MARGSKAFGCALLLLTRLALLTDLVVEELLSLLDLLAVLAARALIRKIGGTLERLVRCLPPCSEPRNSFALSMRPMRAPFR